MRFKFDGDYSPADSKSFEKVQRRDLDKLIRYLSPNKNKVGSIRFFVFDSREKKQLADPNHSISKASARFKEMSVYRYWLPDEDPSYPHELTHLVAHTWGEPYLFATDLDTADGTKIARKIEMVSTSFMQEGLAVAVDDVVFGRKLHERGELKTVDEWCRFNMAKMPARITSVISFKSFCSIPNEIVVPFAGSLTKYLLRRFGVNKYKEAYVAVKEIYSAGKNRRLLEEVFQTNEVALLRDWKRSVV